MGDPHNPKRAGELWNQDRIDYQLSQIIQIKDHIILSGGWAWHFMSPPGHKEIKTQHDHKDIDVFVKPTEWGDMFRWFNANGYERQRTIYDDPSGKFSRYTKFYEGGKVVFDMFLEEMDFIEIDGFRVVEPNKLLAMYGVKHSSDLCKAVVEAKKLVAKGINPVGRPELVYG